MKNLALLTLAFLSACAAHPERQPSSHQDDVETADRIATENNYAADRAERSSERLRRYRDNVESLKETFCVGRAGKITREFVLNGTLYITWANGGEVSTEVMPSGGPAVIQKGAPVLVKVEYASWYNVLRSDKRDRLVFDRTKDGRTLAMQQVVPLSHADNLVAWNLDGARSLELRGNIPDLSSYIFWAAPQATDDDGQSYVIRDVCNGALDPNAERDVREEKQHGVF